MGYLANRHMLFAGREYAPGESISPARGKIDNLLSAGYILREDDPKAPALLKRAPKKEPERPRLTVDVPEEKPSKKRGRKSKGSDEQ